VPLPLYYFLSITAVNILLSWALYLPYRVAHLHFITVANMAISGYSAAWLVMSLHVPFGWALLAGFALGALVGWIVALFIGDAPTFAVVIVGFTFIFIVRTVIENLPAVGGTMGIFGLPNIGGNPETHRWVIMAILAGMLLLTGFFLHRFDHTRLGRAASAVFVDKDLAASLGVDIKGLGMLVQTISCTIAGGTGVLYGFIYKSFHLDFFTFALVGIAMTIIFVGGYATPWGTVVLAPILYGVPLLFPSWLQEWRIVIYGAVLVIVLVLKPEGFITRRFVVTIESFLSGNRKKRNILTSKGDL
jgi:branched-chain amino acid transport system permease protein